MTPNWLKAAAPVRTPCEPIAIVGASCRFPGGAGSLDEFAELLNSGRDAISEVPRSRWNIDEYYAADRGAPGKMYSRRAGFVQDAESFDAAFFNISPREAECMDPQQRMLLEVAWHALEDAAQNPAHLRDTEGGVFLGIGSSDFIEREVLASDYVHIDRFSGTGTFASVAAGRISFLLGRLWRSTPRARRRSLRCTSLLKVCGWGSVMSRS
jgi:acyl transferase domain-containing protein